ncbi:hypothetical protein E1B28_002880 [Marasmius oreades]|uniref:Uncharacterized protein n=1 Tax=Marasmius oreades TaxID=181124 RepID=A0A9P7RNS3_9AGAR|nr:uncharacterized protein E1B28_002880 [Marasmius oreades]KAG7086964.1 hypothetical protein E1B28_002880 [Marasmius oreades]
MDNLAQIQTQLSSPTIWVTRLNRILFPRQPPWRQGSGWNSSGRLPWAGWGDGITTVITVVSTETALEGRSTITSVSTSNITSTPTSTFVSKSDLVHSTPYETPTSSVPSSTSVGTVNQSHSNSVLIGSIAGTITGILLLLLLVLLFFFQRRRWQSRQKNTVSPYPLHRHHPSIPFIKQNVSPLTAQASRALPALALNTRLNVEEHNQATILPACSPICSPSNSYSLLPYENRHTMGYSKGDGEPPTTIPPAFIGPISPILPNPISPSSHTQRTFIHADSGWRPRHSVSDVLEMPPGYEEAR